ncbi:ABC-type nitrate/sulfonate/bicarbonate transport system, ATPase component [Candidatus Sulfotelmatobacter kueseliae]|uniref:ABC-type nitrate/sulfonate/bicarbonate transport system, ATPase component n=1 Tax=Candidatus Sulfotelmatobacter kueseliae TaxID=2042962 RepID=A0A2U3LA21_9BACT|nr:ABC-type nitrate/sulfonate/bicarbonate transport system, ATPase component [Candidatus Sulfotelmatobacter kueseliae]
MSEAIVEAVGIEKSYPQPDGTRIQVVGTTNFVIEPGRIIALLGPSGCGKSTLLRMLSGLAQPTAGTILWHGKALNGQMPNVAIVFQSFALFPWLTVLENVEAPLEARGVPAVERHKRALRTLDTVGLDGFETAYPKELSGGMKQRVGFARALVVEPEVLFMDEPFSALDVLTAENLRGELLELWLNKKMPTSAIFIVTHNIEEAVMMADRVMVLGRNPARVRSDFNIRLKHPRDRKSARFVELVDYIYKVMTEPEVEHALPDAETTAEIILPPGGLTKAAVKKQEAPVRTAKYQMLPHARVGGIAGLLEFLQDRGGHEDLFRLAEQLVMDVEDLLPILEACVLLGFAWLKEGDVQISPQGAAFAEADIQQRKVLFRQAALDHVTILKQIDNILKRKSDHSIADEFFHDILDEHFAEDEVQRQFETAMNWGRYAEIFDYDREHGRLVLTEPPSPAESAPVPNHDSVSAPKS